MKGNKERGINRLLEIVRDKVGLSPAHIAGCMPTDFSLKMDYAAGEGTLVIAFYKGD